MRTLIAAAAATLALCASAAYVTIHGQQPKASFSISWRPVCLICDALASRNSSGTYSLATSPVTSNQVIGSSLWNNTFNDLASSMTDSLDRNGRGGMLAAWRGIDGTQAAPAYSYTSETGTGEYRIGAGDLGVAILGAKRGEWTANGLRVTDGAVATPSLSFFNDTGSGLYRAGSNDIRFAVNGADKTWWAAAGFGVGGAPPSSAATPSLSIMNGSNQTYFYMQDGRGGAGNKLGRLIFDAGVGLSKAGWQFQNVDDTGVFVSSGITLFRDGAATFGSSGQLAISNTGVLNALTVGASGTATAQMNFGSCTLNAGSPATCTATVASGSKCVVSRVGASSVTNTHVVSVSATTMTITDSNGSSQVMNYVCFG